jgi:hypothetical protein
MAKRADKRPDHNYRRKLRYLMRVGALPHAVGLHHITVYHDAWCGIYQDKHCNGLGHMTVDTCGKKFRLTFLAMK